MSEASLLAYWLCLYDIQAFHEYDAALAFTASLCFSLKWWVFRVPQLKPKM